MVFIDKGLAISKLTGTVTPAIKGHLRSILSYENKSHIIARAVARKRLGYIPAKLRWDGITYLIDADNRFPTGLLYLVIEALEKFKEDYQFLPTVEIPSGNPLPLEEIINLWPHQHEAIDAIKLNFTGIIRIGTGGGKTKTAIAACSEIGQFPFLFVVNRISLLDQTHQEYSRYFKEQIGYIGNGTVDVQRINVATIGTLCSMLKIQYKADDKDEQLTYTIDQIDGAKRLLNECKFVIIDECHHAAANTYTTLMKSLPSAFYRIGLSATPFRTDGADLLLNAAFGQVIYSKSASSLIREKWLCKPKIFFVEYKDPLSKVYPKKWAKGVKKPNYVTVYKDCVVENQLFNTIVARCAITNAYMNRLTLVSVRQVKHGEAITNRIREIAPELNTVFLHGKNKIKLDEEQVKLDFTNRKTQILVSTLLDEGVDIPVIEAIVDAGGGSSSIKALQLVGRAIRKSEGKQYAYIYMFIQPYQMLYNHALERASILSSEEEFNLNMLEWKND